ncbi:MAG: DUF1573 domain-containing protein [Chitinophagaceae bacterium]
MCTNFSNAPITITKNDISTSCNFFTYTLPKAPIEPKTAGMIKITLGMYRSGILNETFTIKSIPKGKVIRFSANVVY